MPGEREGWRRGIEDVARHVANRRAAWKGHDPHLCHIDEARRDISPDRFVAQQPAQ
jgi:hypothetical protein